MIIGHEQEVLNPTVSVGSFKWAEPVTTLTDFLVALVCWYAVVRLSRIKDQHSGNQLFRHIFFYFLCFAVGMTSAAWLGHGFQEYISPKFKMIGWVCAATGLLMLQRASALLIQPHISNVRFKLFNALFIVQWAVFLLLIFIPQTSSFKITQVNSTVALIGAVLPMHIFFWRKTGSAGSLGVILALVYSLIPGFIFTFQISLGRWCNFHDISHVLMAIFMFLMFRSLRKLLPLANMT